MYIIKHPISDADIELLHMDFIACSRYHDIIANVIEITKNLNLDTCRYFDGAKILIEAFKLIIMGFSCKFENHGIDGVEKANECFKKAIKLIFSDEYRKTIAESDKNFKYFETLVKLVKAVALTSLGNMYRMGFEVQRDFTKARNYLDEASKLGDDVAMYSLGCMYMEGLGVQRDPKKAQEYFENSIESNPKNYLSLTKLGCIYFEGLVVPQNYKKAQECLEKSAELGDIEAMRILATMYMNGLGVLQDCVKAQEYFEKLAELGDVDAMEILEFMYMYGIGVPQDQVKSDKYHKRIKQAGKQRAIINIIKE